MKIRYIACLIIVIAMAFQSCEKYHGDTLDFSKSLPNYITFSGDDLDSAVLNGEKDGLGKYVADTLEVDLVTRMNLVSAVNYVYTYQIDGGSSTDVQGIYPAEVTSQTLKIATSADMFPQGADSISGKVILKSASEANGGNLTLGYPDSTGAVIIFVAHRPGS